MRTVRRRLVSIPAVFLLALLLTLLLPLWAVTAVVVDAACRRWRMPTLRLLTFALCWAWAETVAVIACALVWIVGQRNNRAVHYRLQAWWASALVHCLQATTGMRILTNVDALKPGPAVMLSRHASLADSLVSAWCVACVAGLRPHYVLKKELLADPCLDIVGNRLPNYFLDRQATDSAPELAALRTLTATLTATDIAVIFPEGTRASPDKRARALASIARTDQARAARLALLRHLLPPRPAGSLAMLAGAPEADVLIGWHAGFDGLDTFGGMIRHLARRPPPVRFAVRRIPRGEVPTEPDAIVAWLDQQWLTADEQVGMLIERDRTPR
jgi:1-acyl-sn-glycerol-3-phosphate acyltransferase